MQLPQNIRSIEDDISPFPTQVGKTPLYITSLANFSSVKPPLGTDSCAYIIVTSEETSLAMPQVLPALPLIIPAGKRGQTHFMRALPSAVAFTQAQLRTGLKVCFVCETGKDYSVGIALAALQQLFNDFGNYVGNRAESKITTGPIVTATLEVFTNEELYSADKNSIRTRLQWIISSRIQANPSRTTLKRVNEYLLSPASFNMDPKP